ncbi:MAG: SH3 domain-containing protein [Chloroflexota bacterium]
MYRRRRGLPAWLIFLLSVAFVLGGYYLWLGLQTYLATGGLGVEAATDQAAVVATTASVRRATEAEPTRTLFPTFTPIPACEDWIVSVPTANIRNAPSVESAVVGSAVGGRIMCVIERVGDTDWYLIDLNTDTRRIEEAYMRNDTIESLAPTPTPTISPTPLPTVTPITPTVTNTPLPTPTIDPDATLPPTATVTPLPTVTPAATSTGTAETGRSL